MPAAFPVNTIQCIRVLTVIQESQPADVLVRALDTYFNNMFGGENDVSGDDWSKPDALVDALVRASVIPREAAADLIARSQSPEIKNTVKDQSELLADKGAFGLPWFVVTLPGSTKTVSLFGSDRFELLANILDLPYYGPNPDSTASAASQNHL